MDVNSLFERDGCTNSNKDNANASTIDVGANGTSGEQQAVAFKDPGTYTILQK